MTNTNSSFVNTPACIKCGAIARYKNGACKPCSLATAAVYREANRVTLNDKKVSWRRANPEKSSALSLAWQSANKEKNRIDKATWRAKNEDRNKKNNAAWQKANPEACRVNSNNRRARKLKAGGKVSAGLFAKLFKLQKGKCACCKQPLGGDCHMDHIMPLALGGSNSDDNMQLLRSICNLKKGAKHPTDFMQSCGFLL